MSGWSTGLKRWLSQAPETRDELQKLVQESHRFLEPDMVYMLEGVLELPATMVRELMTPRTTLAALRTDFDLGQVLAVVLESNHSRYPVFDADDADAVIGILLTKDLIPHLAQKPSTPFDLKTLLRKPLFINENARADVLLRSLQKAQVHMAIALDEFGGVSGVVTMEDLLEEIVGDIVDEHDDLIEDSTLHDITQTDDGWIVHATTPISDCNEKIGANFDDTEIDSMGGLVMLNLGAVSDLMQASVQIDDWRIQVLNTHGRAIETLKLTRLPQ